MACLVPGARPGAGANSVLVPPADLEVRPRLEATDRARARRPTLPDRRRQEHGRDTHEKSDNRCDHQYPPAGSHRHTRAEHREREHEYGSDQGRDGRYRHQAVTKDRGWWTIPGIELGRARDCDKRRKEQADSNPSDQRHQP